MFFSPPVFAEKTEGLANFIQYKKYSNIVYFLDFNLSNSDLHIEKMNLEEEIVEYLEKVSGNEAFPGTARLHSLKGALEGVDCYENCVIIHINTIKSRFESVNLQTYTFSMWTFIGNNDKEHFVIKSDFFIFSDPFVCVIQDSSADSDYTGHKERLFECVTDLFKKNRGVFERLQSDANHTQP